MGSFLVVDHNDGDITFSKSSQLLCLTYCRHIPILCLESCKKGFHLITMHCLLLKEDENINLAYDLNLAYTCFLP